MGEICNKIWYNYFCYRVKSERFVGIDSAWLNVLQNVSLYVCVCVCVYALNMSSVFLLGVRARQ